ncbi:MAG: hypothetical protein Q7S70_01220 [bacterium]|nr:hypothetical protein [bacterium]
MKIKNSKFRFRNLTIAVVLVFSFLLLIPQTQAAPLVPCGSTGQPACQFCHTFVLINNIIRLVFFTLVPSVAVLMFIIGGFYMLTAAGRPEWFNKAKTIITAAVIGLVIMFIALVFLNTLFDTLGVVEWTKLKGDWWSSEWWATTCPITP